MFVNGEYPLAGESCRVNSRIKSGITGEFLSRSDVAAIVATVWLDDPEPGPFGAVDAARIPVPGWDAVELPTTTVLETPIVPDDLAATETEGFNFIWTPDVSETPIFPVAGNYLIRIELTLNNGEKISLRETAAVRDFPKR